MLFKPEKALEIGLVDELANDKANAIEICKNYILSFENIPRKNKLYYFVFYVSLYLILIRYYYYVKGLGRGTTKMEMRKDLIEWFNKNKEADTENFLKLIQLPKVQAGLKFYIEFLKQKQQ